MASAGEEGRSLLPPSQSNNPPTCLQKLVTSCCCLQIRNREEISRWLLEQQEFEQPSLFRKCCLCQCFPETRAPSGIHNIKAISGLAGITMQSGDHSTAGSLHTLRWGVFNEQARTLEIKVFGGAHCFGGAQGQDGQWTEPITASWCCLMNLGRMANYTYLFTFDQDYRRADIDIKCNPLIACCICIPCCPAWCAVPRSVVHFDMIQKAGSSDGSAWDRRSSSLGKELTKTYDLLQVINVDGTPGPYYNKIAEAPEQQMISN